jgi:hypothetical protein
MSTARTARALQTSEGQLGIYHVHASNVPALSGPGITARWPTRDDIYLQHTARIPAAAAGAQQAGGATGTDTSSGFGPPPPLPPGAPFQGAGLYGRDAPPCCITGDSKQLLVGCLDGGIHLVSWTAKVRALRAPGQTAAELPG